MKVSVIARGKVWDADRYYQKNLQPPACKSRAASVLLQHMTKYMSAGVFKRCRQLNLSDAEFSCAELDSLSRKTRDFSCEVCAHCDTRLRHDYNPAMKSKTFGGSQLCKAEGASHISAALQERRGILK